MNSIRFDLNREKCPDCEREILCHSKTMTCHNCNAIYHGSCAEKSFLYDHARSQWTCPKCKASQLLPDRYNPFISIIEDKHGPNEVVDEDMLTVSNILRNCRVYDNTNFNR